jgi:hypothetical protein
MTRGLIFYILMLLWAFFGIYPTYSVGGFPFVGSLLLFVLLLLLAWDTYGATIKGGPPP